MGFCQFTSGDVNHRYEALFPVFSCNSGEMYKDGRFPAAGESHFTRFFDFALKYRVQEDVEGSYRFCGDKKTEPLVFQVPAFLPQHVCPAEVEFNDFSFQG